MGSTHAARIRSTQEAIMRLRTIGLISTLALGLLAGPLPAEAQQAGKVYRIGFIDYRFRSTTTDPRHIAFRQGLRELGYVEGQNYVIEYRSAKGKRERLPEVAAELVRLKVDVIVTSGSPPAIRAAKRATRTIPIVVPGGAADPVKAGFVMSLARPGGNITGLTGLIAGLHPKRLELLKEAFPRISRVAIIWPSQQREQVLKKEVKAVEQALGIQIQSVIADRMDELERAFSAISHEPPDALLVTSSPPALRHRARVTELAAKTRLPTIYDSSIFVRAGGLMAYGANSADNYRRAATYVDKILKGAKPADLPIELPRKFDLVINLTTARKLGFTFSPQFLARADKVIK
jgi:putative ABC transport system substrate-binding protein